MIGHDGARQQWTFSSSSTGMILRQGLWACVLRDDICVQLVMPMPIMIWLAVIVEAAIANWLDMIILLLIQFINASIGWYGSRFSFLCMALLMCRALTDRIPWHVQGPIDLLC